MKFEKWPSWWLLLLAYFGRNCAYADEKYNAIHRDGSFEFSYDTPDSYHLANADRNNVVRGEFGGRNPKTGIIDKTVYTAGPRGYRPRGKNIARKYDLAQIGPRPIGSKDDPYFDPYEDPSYNFDFRTRTYSREENANRFGDVKGSYTYLDDVGERHNVEFIAGKRTGFHVRTPFPDSNPNAYGPLFFNGRGKPIPRGRTAIQRGLDGSYRFISAGPDQRRTETSDATGHVRGSYTYLDDKGVQHSVHYIAGPETGYRVLKNVKGPHLPTIYPFSRPDIIPPDYYDSFNKAEKELFDTAASGRPRPAAGPAKPTGTGSGTSDLAEEKETDYEESGAGNSETRPSTSRPPYGSGGGRRPAAGGAGRPRPLKPPIDEYEDGGEDIDLFGGESGGSSTSRPTTQSETSDTDDGRYKPSISGGQGEEEEETPSGSNGGGFRPKPTQKPAKGDGSYDDGSYKPSGNNGAYKPTEDDTAFGRPRPSGGGGTFDSQRPSKPSDDGGTFDNQRPSKPSGGGTAFDSQRPSDDSRPSGQGGADGGFSSTAAPGDYDTGGDEYPGGTASPRPTYDSDGDEGEQSSTTRPSSVDITRPTGGGAGTSRPGTFGRPGVSTYRPPRPSRPRPQYGGAARPPATNFNESEDDDDDFNLFGSASSGPVSRPGQSSSTTARPISEGDFLGGDFEPQTRPPQRPKPRPGGRPSSTVKPSFAPSSSGGDFGASSSGATSGTDYNPSSGADASRPDFGTLSGGGGSGSDFGVSSSGGAPRPDYSTSSSGGASKPDLDAPSSGGASRPDYGPSSGGSASRPDFGTASSGGASRPDYGPSSGGSATRPDYGPSSGGSATRPDYGPPSGGGATRPDYGPSSGGSATRPDYGPSSGGGATRPDFGPSSGGGASRPNFPPSETGGFEDRDRPAVIGVSSGGGSFYDRGTIVTNLGDKVFSVPPGVSVRAHVQAIDLLPLGSRIPSPSEQYRAETTVQSEQLKEASENVSVSTTTTATSSVGTTNEDDEEIFK